jgi:hypothetical protein
MYDSCKGYWILEDLKACSETIVLIIKILDWRECSFGFFPSSTAWVDAV